MVTTGLLNGLTVLVTRPAAQSQRLLDLLAESGGQGLSFPVIEIEPLPTSSWMPVQLAGVDWLIFVSSNAVHHFLDQVPLEKLSNISIAAVGAATAKALTHRGLKVDCQPELSTGADGLLAQAVMQDVHHQHIVIVRGKGGREHLADTLSERGARLRYIEVYRRACASPTPAQCSLAVNTDMVLCTSNAGVDNLSEILSTQLEQIMAKPLIVVSERVKQHAMKHGFKQVWVSREASDDSIMDTVREINKQHGNG
jgi:uroporphyrinogen-III synthase